MPRTERKISKTKLYYVMSRGLDRQLLFFEEIDYLKYLSIVSELKKDYGVEIIAYCLMSNHIHMVIFDKKCLLAQFIGKLNARYVMYYNKKNFRVGYVFSGRFKSECIEDGDYFLSWNEEANNDRFIEIANNKLTDKEVLQNLYKYCGVKSQKEYNALDESKKIIGVLKLIDDGISIMQISRVSRITYNKIQRLKKGEEGEVVSLTYFPK